MAEQGGVAVGVRIRPRLPPPHAFADREKFAAQAVLKADDCTVAVRHFKDDRQGCSVPQGQTSSFRFDFVWDTDSAQHEVYEDGVVDLVEQCLAGLPAAVIAYGATGSGKTHTVLGAVCLRSPLTAGGEPAGDGEGGGLVTPDSGVFLRVLDDLLCFGERSKRKLQLYVAFSVVEVYGDAVHDLLADRPMRKLRVVVADSRVRIPDATHAPIRCARDVWAHYQRAMARRHTRSTAANEASSRSHALLTLSVVQQRRPRDDGSPGPLDAAVRDDPLVLARLINARDEMGAPVTARGAGAGLPPKVRSGALGVPLSCSAGGDGAPVIVSQLVLADLAGSERGSRSHLPPGSEGFQEMVAINGSLSALGNVVRALHSRAAHVPYRESRLTALLRPSLSPEARVLVVTCCTPTDATPTSQTLSALNFADKVKSLRAARGAGASFEARLEEPYLAALRLHDHLAAEARVLQAAQPLWPIRCPQLQRGSIGDAAGVAAAREWLQRQERARQEAQQAELTKTRSRMAAAEVAAYQRELQELRGKIEDALEERAAIAQGIEEDAAAMRSALEGNGAAALSGVREEQAALAAHRRRLTEQLRTNEALLQRLRQAASKLPQSPPARVPAEAVASIQERFVGRLLNFRRAQLSCFACEEYNQRLLAEAAQLRARLGRLLAQRAAESVVHACVDAAVDIAERMREVRSKPPTPHDNPNLAENLLVYLASGSQVHRRRSSGELVPVTLSLQSEQWMPPASDGASDTDSQQLSPRTPGTGPSRSPSCDGEAASCLRSPKCQTPQPPRASLPRGRWLCWEEQDGEGQAVSRRISAGAIVALVIGCTNCSTPAERTPPRDYLSWSGRSDCGPREPSWVSEGEADGDEERASLPSEFWRSFSVRYQHAGYAAPLSLDVLCAAVSEMEAWLLALQHITGRKPRWVSPSAVPHPAALPWRQLMEKAKQAASAADAGEAGLCAANWLPPGCVATAARRVFVTSRAASRTVRWGLVATKGEVGKLLGLDIFRATALWEHMVRRRLLLDPGESSPPDPDADSAPSALAVTGSLASFRRMPGGIGAA